MAEKFTQYVLQLAEDPKQLASFRTDSPKAMRAAGLTPAEQAVLTSGDATLIRNAIAADVGARKQIEAGGGVWPITVLVAVTVAVLISDTTDPDTES